MKRAVMKKLKEDYIEIKKDFPELLSREAALGAAAHEQLLRLEGNERELKKIMKKKKKLICLYCFEESHDEMFKLLHKCERPQVVEKKKWPCPSRPMLRKFFEIEYNKKIYRFKDYESAMLFRRLIWIVTEPLCKVLKSTELRWYK